MAPISVEMGPPARRRPDLGPGFPNSVQPLLDQGAEQRRLLVWERVAGAVEDGERGPRVLVQEAPGVRVADARVLTSGHDQRGSMERRPVLGSVAQPPVSEDPFQRGAVDRRLRWRRMAHDKEFVIADDLADVFAPSDMLPAYVGDACWQQAQR